MELEHPPAVPTAGPPRGRLLEIRRDPHTRLPLTTRLAWLERAVSELTQGGVYLVTGAPGSRKSGLMTQVGLDFGSQGLKTLVLLTEESPHRLQDRAVRMSSDWPNSEAERAMNCLFCDDTLSIDRLPAFLAEHILSGTGRYHGAKIIIVDSIQGHGLPSTASAAYGRLFEFCRIAKSAGITVFLVGHVTKKGTLSGSRDLEHNVDAVLVLRKVMDLRLLFVTKNRFGPEQLKGMPLVIDPLTTGLRPSPHLDAVTGVARTFLGGGLGVGEMQALVSLPSHAARPQIQAPGLPRRRVEQLLNTIAKVPGLEMDDLDLSIGCLMPGDATFRPMFGLPLCLALIASYLRRPVDGRQLSLGEIDLTRSLRPLNPTILNELAHAISAGEFAAPLRVLCPPSAAAQLPIGPGVEIVPCAKLDDAIRASWPQVELK